MTLSCVAAGSPQPEINWFLDTMPLEPSLNLKIATNIDKDGRVVSTLNLESTSTEDGGVYTCKATNVHGKAQASNRLNIYGMSW